MLIEKNNFNLINIYIKKNNEEDFLLLNGLEKYFNVEYYEPKKCFLIKDFNQKNILNENPLCFWLKNSHTLNIELNFTQFKFMIEKTLIHTEDMINEFLFLYINYFKVIKTKLDKKWFKDWINIKLIKNKDYKMECSNLVFLLLFHQNFLKKCLNNSIFFKILKRADLNKYNIHNENILYLLLLFEKDLKINFNMLKYIYMNTSINILKNLEESNYMKDKILNLEKKIKNHDLLSKTKNHDLKKQNTIKKI